MGLLRCVRIAPGPNACEAARSQRGIEYLGNAIPRLPLAQCVRADCECDYLPVGSKKLRSLYVGKPLPPSDDNSLVRMKSYGFGSLFGCHRQFEWQ